jgi:hypothetical protein
MGSESRLLLSQKPTIEAHSDPIEYNPHSTPNFSNYYFNILLSTPVCLLPSGVSIKNFVFIFILYLSLNSKGKVR